MSVDLRDLRGEIPTRVAVRLEDGEEFEGMLVDVDGDEYSDYSKGWWRFTFEGDWWEQVNDRVDSEVLTLRQDFAISSGRPKEAILTGDDLPDDGEWGTIELGTVDSVERL